MRFSLHFWEVPIKSLSTHIHGLSALWMTPSDMFASREVSYNGGSPKSSTSWPSTKNQKPWGSPMTRLKNKPEETGLSRHGLVNLPLKRFCSLFPHLQGGIRLNSHVGWRLCRWFHSCVLCLEAIFVCYPPSSSDSHWIGVSLRAFFAGNHYTCKKKWLPSGNLTVCYRTWP